MSQSASIGRPRRRSLSWSWRSSARSIAVVGGPALLIGVLAWPLLFSGSIFNEDWINHLWFLWHESLTIRADHLPSLFLNYSHAVFYPEYLFYGATIYTVFGTLSLALGNAPLETYTLSYLLAFAAAYGGWYWLARLAGLGRWQASAPGLVFITSAYYLTLIYARGDWPEFIAVSAIPLMLAAALSVLRAERLHMWPAAALVTSTIVFFGSHNITMLWGSTILIATGSAILVCVPAARREITRSGVVRVAGLMVPALLVNAWFLLPAVVYASQTVIGSHYQHTLKLMKGTMHLVSAKNLLTPLWPSATPVTSFALSLPVLAIAWVLVSIAILLRTARDTAWIRILLIVSALAAAIGVLMTHEGLLLALPRLYNQLQFSYRLETYILLGVSSAVLAVLVLARRGDRQMRIWSWVLVPVLIVSIVGAIQRTTAYPGGNERSTAFSAYLRPPLTKAKWTDFLDIPPYTLPYVVESHSGPREIEFPATAVHGDRVSATVPLSPGAVVNTNIAAVDPSLLHITGARIVGINQIDNYVLEVNPGAGSARRGESVPTETISVSEAESLPIVLGRLLTLGAILALAVEFAALAVRGIRARRA
jgi:hypothetical protein